MPRAVIGREFGPPESYVLGDYDPGPPKAGELRVVIKFAGISYVDVLTAMGKYQFQPPLPFIPGSEYAGIVEELGQGVTRFRPRGPAFSAVRWGVFFRKRTIFRQAMSITCPKG